jgi:CMP-N,N'-diacetyllegionaminic acid synthase
MHDLCLIPAKGSSKRLPRKNLLHINGTPLLLRCLNKALNCDFFDTVCVSTEDEQIAKLATQGGAEVPFIRPVQLSQDPSTLSDVIRHALRYYQETGIEVSTVTMLLPTSPFLEGKHIYEAICLFREGTAPAVLSVTSCESPPFNTFVIEQKLKQPRLAYCFPDSKFRKTKSTECPETYRSNGAILILDVQKFLEVHSFHELEIAPYVMEQRYSVDIDTQFEYQMACALEEISKH